MRFAKFISLLLFLIPMAAFGQYFGGYFRIEYPGGNQDFKIYLHTFTDDADPSQYCSATITIDYGSFSVPYSMTRENGPLGGCDSITTVGQSMGYGLMRNRYSVTVPQNGNNTFTVHFQEPGYSAQIVNQPGGQRFDLRMFVDQVPGSSYDESPKMLNTDPLEASVGQDLTFNPGWYDLDGDSTVFTILPPEGLIGYNGLETYSDTFRVDPNTSLLELLNPNTPGWFTFSIQCESFRNGSSTGFMVLNQVILVNDTGMVSALPEQLDSESRIQLFPNPIAIGSANTYFNLLIPKRMSVQEVVVFDLQGKQVLPTFIAPKSGSRIAIDRLSEGVYFVVARTKTESFVLKMLVR
jgi:hypothetical protein